MRLQDAVPTTPPGKSVVAVAVVHGTTIEEKQGWPIARAAIKGIALAKKSVLLLLELSHIYGIITLYKSAPPALAIAKATLLVSTYVRTAQAARSST